MSLLAILAFAAAPVVDSPVADEQPIVVIGKRLDTWRGRLMKARGAYRCRTERSTGDRAIDAIGCQALMTCTVPLQPQLDAIIAQKQAKADRQRRLQALLNTTLPCLKDTRDDLVQQLADRRSAA